MCAVIVEPSNCGIRYTPMAVLGDAMINHWIWVALFSKPSSPSLKCSQTTWPSAKFSILYLEWTMIWAQSILHSSKTKKLWARDCQHFSWYWPSMFYYLPTYGSFFKLSTCRLPKFPKCWIISSKKDHPTTRVPKLTTTSGIFLLDGHTASL